MKFTAEEIYLAVENVFANDHEYHRVVPFGEVSADDMRTVQKVTDALNAKLAEWLSQAPTVRSKGFGTISESWWPKPFHRDDDTHTAKLVEIKEIEK